GATSALNTKCRAEARRYISTKYRSPAQQRYRRPCVVGQPKVSAHRRYDQVRQRQGDHPPPAYVHQLVIAIAREGGAIPDEGVEKRQHLGAKPEYPLNGIEHRRKS